jgi:hypothetical protein
MRITMMDDGLVHTHDDAAALIRYAALGATVVFDPLRQTKRKSSADSTREFTLVLDAAPAHAVNARDLYALPCKAHRLAARVRDLCESARAALAPLVVGG